MINEARHTEREWRRWTRGAVECYNRSCICEGCPVKDILSSECQMKYAVISLVRTQGLPPKNRNIENKRQENQKLLDTISAYMDEGFNLKEIAEILNRPYYKVQTFAKLNGLDTTRNRGNWRRKKNEQSKS